MYHSNPLPAGELNCFARSALVASISALAPQCFRTWCHEGWGEASRENEGDTRPTKRRFLFLVVRPGAPSSLLAPSSDARSP